MNRQWLGVLVALGWAPVAAGAQERPFPPKARDLVGCWSITVGQWEDRGAGFSDSAELRPPARIRLDTVPGVDWLGRPYRGVVSADSSAFPRPRAGAWLGEQDSRTVVMDWGNGFSGLSIRAELLRDTLRGTISWWSDDLATRPFPHAPVVLARAACANRDGS